MTRFDSSAASAPSSGSGAFLFGCVVVVLFETLVVVASRRGIAGAGVSSARPRASRTSEKASSHSASICQNGASANNKLQHTFFLFMLFVLYQTSVVFIHISIVRRPLLHKLLVVCQRLVLLFLFIFATLEKLANTRKILRSSKISVGPSVKRKELPKPNLVTCILSSQEPLSRHHLTLQHSFDSWRLLTR